jgi:hypothetical protein
MVGRDHNLSEPSFIVSSLLWLFLFADSTEIYHEKARQYDREVLISRGRRIVTSIPTLIPFTSHHSVES